MVVGHLMESFVDEELSAESTVEQVASGGSGGPGRKDDWGRYGEAEKHSSEFTELYSEFWMLCRNGC